MKFCGGFCPLRLNQIKTKDMRTIFISLLFAICINSFSQEKKFNSLQLTFAPGFNNLGLQYNRVVNIFTYQGAVESNFSNSYRNSLCLGYYVGNDFYFTVGLCACFALPKIIKLPQNYMGKMAY